MDDDRQDDRERAIRSLGAGFLVRWDLHDPGSLEAEVGPVIRPRTGERDRERERERELQEVWFD